ncbi:MAG: PP0621 family protein [Pseudomonadota bacterium]
MSKLITIAILVVLGVYLFRRMAGKRVPPPEPPREKGVEDMVRCQVCGVNMPRSEAILSKGRFYCCDEHRRQDA